MLNTRAEHARVISEKMSLSTLEMDPLVLRPFSTEARSSDEGNRAHSRTLSYSYTISGSRSVSHASESSRAAIMHEPLGTNDDTDEDDDNMYIPYNGPKIWTKPGDATRLKRDKTLPSLPPESARCRNWRDEDSKLGAGGGDLEGTHEDELTALMSATLETSRVLDKEGFQQEFPEV